MDEKIHDEIEVKRVLKELAALEHVKNAGMDPYLNITVGHYNANTTISRTFRLFKNKRYKTLLNVAVLQGSGKMQRTLYDDKDREYLRKIRKEYKI